MRDWQGISEFVAVAEQQSFTAAAQKLGLSVAQVSRNVSELEKRLTVKLLYRSTRRVSLTEEGTLYLQHCRHLVQSLDEADRTMSNLKAVPQGTLKITAPVYFGETRIAPILHDFLSEYPDMELDLQLTNDKLDLIQGSFDLAIRLGQLHDSSLIARRLGKRTHYLVASPAYLKESGMPGDISELSQHQCLTGTVEHWRFMQSGKNVQFRPRGRIRCNSGLALMDAALKGLGIAQLPDYYVAEKINQGCLVVLLDDDREPDDGIWALYPQNRHLSAKVRRVVDFLQQALSVKTI
ncbi:LysR family transcriptional regulator [Aliidiomarina minuta]|uniref:LysR family transcriptional regulator n=1 Tax=Aliidiomarina minuta TaxID=880057 RepID=A0A432W4C6_9GAMM|nr:LysR substrate-binding domain-containing protein [Aliidiomarina minuta]RUO24119.1 LysR family transcriptional regulator [Aliidiomarina minuta]